jgi:peptidoglycan/LPS O-acetylase OafA/YrhL
VDSQRWFGFDLVCAWQDVSLMALMFFLSGLFVSPSLERKGTWTFLSERLLRIGVPCVLAIIFLMPVAYYPAYRATAADPGVNAYWRHWLSLPFWPTGPQWFLCQLLALTLLVAVLRRLAPRWSERLSQRVAYIGQNPLRFFVALVFLSAVAYVPLALAYSPFTWVNVGAVSLQLSRPLCYLVYFVFGFAVGACDLDHGLLACDGALARGWLAWLAAAVACFVLWAVPTSATMTDWSAAPFVLKLAAALGFVAAAAAGSMFLLAVCLRFARGRTRAFDSLSANAYGMYLVHYPFVVWLQYSLLGVKLFAIGKAAIVFGGALTMSWAVTAAMAGMPLASKLIATRRRMSDA